MFRNFEILVVMRRSPTIRECFDSNTFDKTELLEAIGTKELDDFLNLSNSRNYDSDSEWKLEDNPDVHRLVETAFRKFDQRFAHFTALGLPPNLAENIDAENDGSQTISIIDASGEIKTVQIPKSVELTDEAPEQPFLKNFVVVNLRKIKESLGDMTLKKCEIQDTLVVKILKELGSAGEDKLRDKKRGRSPSRRRSPRRQSPRRASPKRNFERKSKIQKVDVSMVTRQGEKANFSDVSPSHSGSPPTVIDTGSQNFNQSNSVYPPPPPTPNANPFLQPTQYSWSNPQMPLVDPNNMGPYTGWVQLPPPLGTVFFPQYQGSGDQTKGQIELNRGMVQALYQGPTQHQQNQMFR